jgi:hypothetical protein
MIAFLGGFFLGGVFGIIAMAFAIAAKENKEGK